MTRFFTRWIFRSYKLIGRLQHWASRRFTPLGLTLLIGLVLTLAVGANLDQSIGFQTMVIVVGLITTAMVMALFFRASFQAERLLPRFGCINEPLRYRVWLLNKTDRHQVGLQYLEDLQLAGLNFEEFHARLRPGNLNRTFRLSAPLPNVLQARTKALSIGPVPAHGRVQLTGEVTPLKRGSLHFGGSLICRADPLGVFRSFVRVRNPQTVLILPRRYPVGHINLPGDTRYQHGGVALASGIGESEEFTSLREYRRGDSLRRIHWRSFARMGKPIVKEFQSEFFVRHALLLDTFCEVAMDDVFEEAVAVAASFACTIPDQDSLLDLMFVGPSTVCLTSGRGVGHTEQMLEVLAAVTPNRSPGFPDLTSLVLQHSADLSGCILVLMAWDAPRRDLVAKLKSLRVPQHVILLVPSGQADKIDRGKAEDQPERFTVIEHGKVGEGLAAL